jgi:hypothetical protein
MLHDATVLEAFDIDLQDVDRASGGLQVTQWTQVRALHAHARNHVIARRDDVLDGVVQIRERRAQRNDNRLQSVGARRRSPKAGRVIDVSRCKETIESLDLPLAPYIIEVLAHRRII